MGFMDKFRSFVETGDDDDYIDEEEVVEEKPVVHTPAPAKQQPKSAYEVNSKNTAPELDERTKMVLFEPRSFAEAETVGARLKEGRAVVVNLHKLDKAFARRTIDFLSGVVYALEGSVQKIGPSVILCYPKEIGVAGSISFGADDNTEDNVED